MNTLRRWWLYVLSGHYGKQRFHAYLQWLAVVHYAARENELATFDRAFFAMPEVNQYWTESVPHHWRAYIVGGGSSQLFKHCTKSKALAQLMVRSPRCTIINVDDNMHFIFYKQAE